jgi:hypothetical protein
MKLQFANLDEYPLTHVYKKSLVYVLLVLQLRAMWDEELK